MGVWNSLSSVVVRRWVHYDVLLFVMVVFSVVFLAATRAQADPVAEEDGFFIEDAFAGFEADGLITAIRFAPDGRAFIAERRGRILVFEDLDDPTPNIIDLTDQVHGMTDRGLLGLAVDPNFPEEPWIYTFYTLDTGDEWQDGPWGSPDDLNDWCPTPPGHNQDGCVVAGRLSRMTIDENNNEGSEEVLMERNWCFQFSSHSADDLVFGGDGMLYLSAGEGASYVGVDYGNWGGELEGTPVPENPCQDPPYPDLATEENGQGGMLRSQDLRTGGDELGYNGAVLRIDPDTGDAAAGNPLYDPTLPPEEQAPEARMIAHGFRNPYRIAIGPGGDLFVGDVGRNNWEEINRVEWGGQEVMNFGWPCYEGREQKMPLFESLGNALCDQLYAEEDADDTTVAEPMFEYHHGSTVWPGAEGGGQVGSSLSGLAFMQGGQYPSEWDKALVFADYSRQGVWALKEVGGQYVDSEGTGGALDVPKDGAYLISGAGIVDIQPGPDGNLYLVDLDANRVFRLRYDPDNVPPTAVIGEDGLDGDPPLTVTLSGTDSTDLEDQSSDLSYEWDLDGDGVYGDATGVEVTAEFESPTRVGLRVTDTGGKYDTDTVTVLPPHPGITKLAPARRWRVGDEISLSGSPRPGAEPPQRYLWTVEQHHCAVEDPDDCHIHPLFSAEGEDLIIDSAPDHSYPSFLAAKLVAEYPDGMRGESWLKLPPRTSTIRVVSPEVPVEVSVGETTETSPVSWEAIEMGRISLSVPASVNHDGQSWVFDEWSDGGARVRELTVPQDDLTLIAIYNGRRAPEIDPIPDRQVVAGTTFTETISATDPDGDAITFSLPSAPSGVTIGAHTGVITWIPTESQADQTFTFRVRATDDWDPPSLAEATFQVHVDPPPPPTTVPPPPTTEPPPTTKPPPTTEPPDGAGFIDTAGSVHERDIEALAASGITLGCNPPENSMFCPEEAVTRAQMASFLTRGLDLPPGDAIRFIDTEGSVHEADIGSLAEAGITLGCNPPENDMFCPEEAVTRAQMASFLTRGLDLPPGDAGRFTDVGDSVHEADIGSLAEAGITLGCNPPQNHMFCPEEAVTRAQMASFLVRGLELPIP